MERKIIKAKTAKAGILERLGDRFTEYSRRFMPDAFIFALLLTFATWILAMIFTPKTPIEILLNWSEGFWGVLQFSMQSSYGLILCTMLAMSPIFKAGFKKLASIPRTHTQVQLLNVTISILLMTFHWGMLVAAGIFARELAIVSKKRGIKVHYPLLIAGAYAGLAPWHLGLSGASQLLIATEGNFLEGVVGVIPTAMTLFHPYSYGALVLLSIVTITTITLMTPTAKEKIEEAPDEVFISSEEKPFSRAGGIWGKFLDSKIWGIAFGVLILSSIAYDMAVYHRGWDLNSFIVVLYGLGFIMHMSLRTFSESIWDSVRAGSQIFLQFQFYGGIMGLMVWTGLANVIASGFASVANTYTWPFLNFIQAGIVNFFIPSGGGQVTATGQIIAQATEMIGSPFAPTIITTFAMGDQWTNMIQPFWAIPVIAIAGLHVRRIMGYTTVVLIATGIAAAAWILIVTPLMGVM